MVTSKGWYHAATCVASDEMVAMPPTSSLHLPYISPISPLYLRYISTCAASDEMAAMPPMETPRKTWSGPGPGLGPGAGTGIGAGTRAGTGTGAGAGAGAGTGAAG